MLFKEIKINIKSITFWVLTAMIVFFYLTQFVGDFETVSKPISPEEFDKYGYEPNYGTTYTDDLEQIMKNTYIYLHNDYLTKESLVETILINKYIKLNEKQLNVIENALNKIVPNDIEDNDSFKLSKDEFYSLMDEVNSVLGGKSYYRKDRINLFFASRPMTYEEALVEYNELIQSGLPEAYSRIFLDYIGLPVGLFSVFIAAFTLIRDKRIRSREFIYTSTVSSIKLVITRFLGIVIPVMITVFIVAVMAAFKVNSVVNNLNIVPFIYYSLYWILPTLLFVVAAAFVLQLVFKNGVVPIIAICLLWYNTINFTVNQYSLTHYIIRYNAVTAASEYNAVSQAILTNRMFYIVVSIILLFISIIIYDWQRRKVND